MNLRRKSLLVLLAMAGTLPAVVSGPAHTAAAAGLSASPVEARTTFRPNPVDAARALAVEPDGTVIYAGAAGGDFGLVRSSPYSYNPFSIDGLVTADFDGRDDAANAVVATGDNGAIAAGSSSGDVAVLQVDDRGFPSTVFGAAGRVRTDLGRSDDAAYGVAHLADGSIVVAGGNAVTAALVRYRPDGSLDPAFGSGGIRRVTAPGPWRALAVQPDGKLVVAGGGSGMTVARYLPDGSPDPSFGSGGQTVLLAGTNAVAHAVGIAADGTIAVAGGRSGDITMARVNGTGSPVLTFGVGGVVVVDLGSTETAYGLALGDDGVITIVGEYADMGFAGVFLPSGLPNPAAGPTGITLTDVGFDAWRQKLRGVVRESEGGGFLVTGSAVEDFYTGRFTYSDGRGWFVGGHGGLEEVFESAVRAVRQSDGKVVIAGETGGMLGMVRHNPDTSLDSTFGYGGRAVSDLIAQPRALALDGSGRTVVAGLYHDQVALLRFTAQGKLDTTFGTRGRVVSDAPTERSLPGAVLVLPGGKILVVGAASSSDGWGGWVARFNADGSPDLTFGQSGWRTRAFMATSTVVGTRLLLQPDGKVVVVGFQKMVTRLNPDGTRDPGFGTDGTFTSDTVINFEGAALLPDGRILLGTSRFGNGEYAVTRLLPNGQADPSWDSRAPYGMTIGGQVVIPLADGRVLAIAGSGGARLLATGEPDRSFGDAGQLVLTERSDGPLDAFLDPDGTLYIAGGNYWPATASFTFARTRTGMPGRLAPASWGWGPQGQLGTGTTADHPAPVSVVGLTNVASLSAGTYHNLALRTDGSVWAWGWNVLGQLGDGTTIDRHLPVRVADLGPTFVSVAAGAVHSLALTSSGTVYAWGWNAVGQLGDGTSIDRHRPVQVLGLEGPYWRFTIQEISAGAYHSLAVSTQGGVHAWGWNGYGQLGDGTTLERHLPVAVAGLSEARSVSAGWLHSLAALSDGTVRSWGWNGAGQLGDGTLTDRYAPVPVTGLNDVRSASAGVFHSLAVRMDGSVRTWGWNGAGTLGTGGTTDSPVPVSVPITGVAVGSAGGVHSLVS